MGNISSGELFYGKEGSLQLWPRGLYEMQFGANEQHGSTGTPTDLLPRDWLD